MEQATNDQAADADTAPAPGMGSTDTDDLLKSLGM